MIAKNYPLEIPTAESARRWVQAGKIGKIGKNRFFGLLFSSIALVSFFLTDLTGQRVHAALDANEFAAIVSGGQPLP
jgi:hypothetical protein